jgi:hypothetical protein
MIITFEIDFNFCYFNIDGTCINYVCFDIEKTILLRFINRLKYLLSFPILKSDIIFFYLGFYLFHESMLESVIYARDHFLLPSLQNDDNTPGQDESILIFPSHAYLVCIFILNIPM